MHKPDQVLKPSKTDAKVNSWLESNGVTHVHADIRPNNEASQSSFKSMGFEHWQTRVAQDFKT